ncbi:MAG TPA: OmpA family protein [Candidatus Sulfotelmatobacter sp.]|nr:OmpA family protein [Candidatus Sulfotelmatobacter sp.]
MNKFIYTAALALAAAIASTGCVHRPYDVKAIPPGQNAQVGDQNPVTYQAPPVQNPPPVPYEPGPVVEPQPISPPAWTQDPKALAANTLHFSYDSAVIRDSDRAHLKAVARALKSDKSANLMIEGNCDERGTEEYNRALGERRAEAAREALVAMGIDGDRIHTVSYGKDKPADTGHSSAAHSRNRRDDFVLLHPNTGA